MHVYVTNLMEDGKIAKATDLSLDAVAADPLSVKSGIAKLNLAAAILAATDPLANHPGVKDPLAPVNEWPLQEPWKPVAFKAAAK